jgi:hypothetical protein
MRLFQPCGRPTSVVRRPGQIANRLSCRVAASTAASSQTGLSDRLREGPDAQQEFGIVLPTKMGLFLEVLVIGELGSHVTGK